MKSNSLRVLLGVALLSLAADAVRGQEIADELKGKLVALRGKSLLPADTPDLPQAKYIALYFSAGWCGPCHQFTPGLVKFYQEMKPKYPGFEIVFMSEDQSSNAMEKYMGEMSMPWPALRYSFAKNDRKLSKYAGPGIPCLVLLDEKGTVISDSYAGSNYLGPHKVMNDLKKLLSTGTAPAVAKTEAAPVIASSPAATNSASNTVKSPSGTNWDEVFKKKSP